MWRGQGAYFLRFGMFLSISLVLSVSFSPLFILNSYSQEEINGNITFQPNIIDSVSVHFVEEFFRFQWLGNRFDLKLTIGYNDTDRIKELSLKDFWEKTDRTLKWKEVLEKSSVFEFGYNITDIPQEYADRCLYLLWKIEEANFHPIVDVDLGEIWLNDNLQMSYHDLLDYGFTVNYLSNHTTQILNVTGKTSWNLDPITYSGNIMTMVEFGSSGSWAANMFWEFWNASDANGWAVAEKTVYGDDTQFAFGCRLKIGNDTEAGQCYVYDEEVQVYFNSTTLTGHYQSLIEVSQYSHMRLGRLIDGTEKTSERGISLIAYDNYIGYLIYGDANSETLLYSSQFGAIYFAARFRTRGTATPIYNCLFSNVYLYDDDCNVDLYDVTFMRGARGLYHPTGTFQELKVYGCTRALTFLTPSTTLTNGRIRNSSSYDISMLAAGADQYLINFDIDTWLFEWAGAGTNAELYRQYYFDLTVLLPDNTGVQWANVTVSHYGQAETEDFSELTDANGAITQQTLNMGFYNSTGGDTIYNYNPYHVEISNVTGYLDYSGNFTLDTQQELTIILTEEPVNWIGLTLLLGLLCVVACVYALTTKD